MTSLKPTKQESYFRKLANYKVKQKKNHRLGNQTYAYDLGTKLNFNGGIWEINGEMMKREMIRNKRNWRKLGKILEIKERKKIRVLGLDSSRV